MTIEQKRALAMAAARLRVSPSGTPKTLQKATEYSFGDVGKDVLNTVPMALTKGAVALTGIPGALEEFGQWAGRQVGIEPPNDTPEARSKRRLFADPSEMIARSGSYYEPTTPVGKAIEPYVASVPGALLAGPVGGEAGVAATMGTNALKYGVVPTAAGQAAGAVGKAIDPSLEEPAAIAGSTLAGGRAILKDTPSPMAPSTVMLREQAAGLYEASNKAGVVLKPEAHARLVDAVSMAAHKAKIDINSHKVAFGALKQLEDSYGTVPTLEEIDTFRKRMGDAVAHGDSGERRMGLIMTKALDKELDTIGAADMFFPGVNPRQAVRMLKDARALWRKQANGTIIESAIFNAKLGMDKNKSHDLDARLRAEFAKIAQRDKLTGDSILDTFDKPTQRAIMRVIHGGPIERVIEMVGRFSPQSRPFTALGATSAGSYAAYSGKPGLAALAYAIPAAGYAANKALGKISMRQANAASAMARGGRQPSVGRRLLHAAKVPAYLGLTGGMATTPPPDGRAR